MLQISLLGPLEVRRDGRLVSIPGGKPSELLVRLALEPGVYIRADRLVDELWTAGSAGTRRNTLQTKVTLLRRALSDPAVIASGDGSYALGAEPFEIDALIAVGNTATAARLADSGDDRRAADLCSSTLKLFHGELLPAAGDGNWAVPFRARLDEVRMRLVDLQFMSRLRVGEVADVIGELEEAVATYPFHETLWELLITALYQAGRQSDALTSYQRVRTLLSDELGLEPGTALQQLERRILRHDPALGSAQPTTGSSKRVARNGNLPSMAVDLVGRGPDLDALAARLAESRLVVVVGPGGVGKTALAIALGRRISASDVVGSAGVWLARLETASTPDDVVDTLIAALDVVGGEPALVERLRSTGGVVILDNCEHVLDAAAALTVRLLDAAPGLRILCTSQVPLDVDGEDVFELAPLQLADAVNLFTRRATVQRLPPLSEEGDDSVLNLCRSLDGLPLAIELAAARTRTLSIEEITRRLDDRLAVLSDPTSRRSERRRSLRSTIRWSYDLLFPDDQRGLWALSCFAGGASLAAVESVLEALEVPATAAIDVVSRLVSRSLVIVDDDGASTPVTAGSQPRVRHSVRYRLLDSIRAFATEAATDAGVIECARTAHAAWFAQRADLSTAGVRSHQQAEQLSFVRMERANIDVALAWSTAHDPPLALRIAIGFGWAWVVLGDSRGAQRISDALAAAGDAGRDRDRAGALLLAGWIEASAGHLGLARSHILGATELAETIDDVELQARCAYYLAYVVSHHGEFRQATELLDHSRAIYDELDRPWDQAAIALFEARAAIAAGDQHRSEQAVARVEQWLHEVDDPWLQVRGDAIVGELARVAGHFEEAVVRIGRAADTSRRLGFLQTAAYQQFCLGRAQCQAGNYRVGTESLVLAIHEAEATGDVRLAALAKVHLGSGFRVLGRSGEARASIAAAAAWQRTAGGGEEAALAECLLAAMDAADGTPDAEGRLRRVLDDARLTGDAPVEVLALDALARLAVEAADPNTARELSDTADRRMTAAARWITDRDRIDAHLVRGRLEQAGVGDPFGTAAASRPVPRPRQ